MQVLKQGKYSGSIIHARGKEGVIACITAYDTDKFNDSLHCHDNAHFSFTIQGGCVEKKKEAYEITPGHITYYSAGDNHQVLKVPEPTRRVNLELEQCFFDQFGITDNEARSAVTQSPDAKFLMVKIFHELLANDLFSEVSVRMLLLQLISGIKRQRDENTLPTWVKTVRDFLHDHTEDNITLEDLSRTSGLHPVTISKQFPRYFSCTLGEYKRKLKIEKALALIKSAPVSLTGVAYQCGFFDQSHFIRTFKHLTDCLPATYKKL